MKPVQTGAKGKGMNTHLRMTLRHLVSASTGHGGLLPTSTNF